MFQIQVEDEGVPSGQWQPGSLRARFITLGINGAILEVFFSPFPAYVSVLGFPVEWARFFMLAFGAARAATFLGVGHAIDRVREWKFMLAGTILPTCVMALGLTGRTELL